MNDIMNELMSVKHVCMSVCVHACVYVVVYVYMYRLAANPNLQNQKRLRQAPVYLKNGESEGNVYHHRPPVLIDLFYMLAVYATPNSPVIADDLVALLEPFE